MNEENNAQRSVTIIAPSKKINIKTCCSLNSSMWRNQKRSPDVSIVNRNIFKMSRTGSEMRKSEAQSKMIQDRITAIERHLGTLCDTLSSYTRKTARLRDKGDLLAKEIVSYAEYEKLNPTLKSGLTSFAEHLSAVQDYRQAEVQRLEAKAVKPVSNYGLLCKQTKNELKSAFAAHDREQSQRKKLDKVQQKHPSDQQQILCERSESVSPGRAQTELQKASVDATRTERALEQQMESFESKKLHDIKKVLADFVNIEMIFHAKALEVYTQCYQSLSVIEPECDLEEFLAQIHPNNDSRRLSIASTASKNSERLTTPGSTPSSLRREEPASKQLQNTPKQTPKNLQQNNNNASQQPKPNTAIKQNVTTVKSKPNKKHPSPRTNDKQKQSDSPARRIIPVGTLKDESDDDDDDYDDDDSEYDDDDDSDDYETTEASTARTPHLTNGTSKK